MRRFCTMCAIALLAGTSLPAHAASWEIRPAEGNHGITLIFDPGKTVTYRFECTASDIVVTETGVTDLLDVKSGNRVPDTAGATMPPGSALMALFGGKGQSPMMPAEAVKNPAGGWDLSIRLTKNDKQFDAVAKGKMVSIFTTGYTMLVVMDDAAVGRWKDFTQRCRTAT
jgi:hypothetical protein